MFVWLAGGEGSLNLRMDVVDPERFVLVALPYPQGAANPKQANMVGDFPAIWKYHATMLGALQQRVPNLSPLLRVIGGFSNGAHAIDGFLTLRAGEISPVAFAFNVYVMADGGMAFGDYSALRGKHLFVCWGEKGHTNKERCSVVVEKARAAGVLVEAVAMEDTGHAFPQPYAHRAGAWITDRVIPDLMLEMNDRLRRMKALGHIDQIQQVLPHLQVLTEDPVRLAFWRRLSGIE